MATDESLSYQLMNIGKQIDHVLADLRREKSAPGRADRLKHHLKQLIQSPDPAQAVIVTLLVDEVIRKQDVGSHDKAWEVVAKVTRDHADQIAGLAMLFEVYLLWQAHGKNGLPPDWRAVYVSLRVRGAYAGLNGWLESGGEHRQQALARWVALLPQMLYVQKIDATQIELETGLLWISLWDANTAEDQMVVTSLVGMVKEVGSISLRDFERKEHYLLRRIIELIGRRGGSPGSLHLFFDPLSMSEQDVEYFCHIYEAWLEQLDEQHLVGVFRGLTAGGLNRPIYLLLKKISKLLHSNQEYYTLRILYQQFILPFWCTSLKTHRRLAPQVYKLAQYYVAGFLSHCALDQTGVQCLIENLQFLQDKALRIQWAELALLACKDDEQLLKFTQKSLQKLNLDKVSCQKLLERLQKDDSIWVVTLRNGRKLKKYPEIQSRKFVGIRNRMNECYIISTVQALFTTNQLSKVVGPLQSQAKKRKVKVIEELTILFNELRTKKDNLTVKYLKSLGPEQFKQSHKQEDAQQYMLALLDSVEVELSASFPKQLERFHKHFRIQYQASLGCKACGHRRPKGDPEHTYVHSISHNQSLKLQTQEAIEGYKCEKCGKKDTSTIRTKVANRPSIFIAHINRFSHGSHGAQKRLGNRPIPRQLEEYHLAGFISHRGSSQSAGHYMYYGKVEAQRWGLFNDGRVTEFRVGENEAFEREFKPENTPYLLFYTKH